MHRGSGRRLCGTDRRRRPYHRAGRVHPVRPAAGLRDPARGRRRRRECGPLKTFWPKEDEVLQVFGEDAAGPDKRGRYWVPCPECGGKLELSPDGSGMVVPRCHGDRCRQDLVSRELKRRAKAARTDRDSHDKTEGASPAPPRETVGSKQDPIEAMKVALLRNPETGNLDYLRLQARCVRAFDPVVGIFARQATYWHGRSTKLRDGWVYKKREEWCEETGLTHRQLEKARRVLREKGILEEDRPFQARSDALQDRSGGPQKRPGGGRVRPCESPASRPLSCTLRGHSVACFRATQLHAPRRLEWPIVGPLYIDYLFQKLRQEITPTQTFLRWGKFGGWRTWP